MRKLCAVVLALPLVGCASSARTVYHPPVFGDGVGCIIAIEDKETGILIYKMVEGTGRSQMQVLVPRNSDWRKPEE